MGVIIIWRIAPAIALRAIRLFSVTEYDAVAAPSGELAAIVISLPVHLIKSTDVFLDWPIRESRSCIMSFSFMAADD